jgi:transposase InsO family protein
MDCHRLSTLVIPQFCKHFNRFAQNTRREGIVVYSNRRPHRRLNFKSPFEVEAAYYANLKA